MACGIKHFQAFSIAACGAELTPDEGCVQMLKLTSVATATATSVASEINVVPRCFVRQHCFLWRQLVRLRQLLPTLAGAQ